VSDHQHGPRDISIGHRLLNDGIDSAQVDEHRWTLRRRMLHFSRGLHADQREHADESAPNP
jgi:hypothetical protein